MFTLWFMALLCLLPLSQAAPVACGALVKPLAQVDLGDYQGRWIFVADSVKVIQGTILFASSSVIHLSNSSYTQGLRFGLSCMLSAYNYIVEGSNYHTTSSSVTINGTAYQSSCQDCLILTFNVDSPLLKFQEVSLLSRRREVEQKDLEEFRDQLECLKMPPHTVMDPKIELCAL